MSQLNQDDIISKIHRLQELERRQQTLGKEKLDESHIDEHPAPIKLNDDKQLEIKGKAKKGFKNIIILFLVVMVLFIGFQTAYIAGRYYLLNREINLMNDRINQIAAQVRVQETASDPDKITEKYGDK